MDSNAGLVIVLLTRRMFCVCGYTVFAALHGLSLQHKGRNEKWCRMISEHLAFSAQDRGRTFSSVNQRTCNVRDMCNRVLCKWAVNKRRIKELIDARFRSLGVLQYEMVMVS